MTAFQNGIANGDLIHKWTHKPPASVNDMFRVANSWADGEEAQREQLNEFKYHWDEENRSSRKRGNDRHDDEDRRDDNHRDDNRRGEARPRKRRSEADTVAALERPKGRITPEDFQRMLDMQCPYHKNHKHSARECYGLKRAFRGGGDAPPSRKRDDDPLKHGEWEEEAADEFQPANRVAYMIYGGPDASESRRQ